MKNSIHSWFSAFNEYLDKGLCDELPDGIEPFLKTVPQKQFKACLFKWIKFDFNGINFMHYMKFDETGTILEGWTQ